MSLTDFRSLGRSGLIVSPLALGTMTFGPGRWGADQATSRSMFDAYLAAGGNFVDTADIYSNGESERLVGKFIADSGTRDEIVLATKFAFNGTASPNAGGAGAKNIHRALDASLKRLRTDHIDLYWMHIWDGVTPVKEIAQTLSDLVRVGKIRYYGLSDMPAWLAMKAATLAAERRVPGPIAMQVEYSLVARDVESEHFPAAREGGMGIMPWSPLAGGFLSGKYRRGDTADTGRLSGANPFGDSKFADRNWDVLAVLKEVSDELGHPMAQIALAWTLARRGVADRREQAHAASEQHCSDRPASAHQSDEASGRGEHAGDRLQFWPDHAGHPAHGVRRSQRRGLGRVTLKCLSNMLPIQQHQQTESASSSRFL